MKTRLLCCALAITLYTQTTASFCFIPMPRPYSITKKIVKKCIPSSKTIFFTIAAAILIVKIMNYYMSTKQDDNKPDKPSEIGESSESENQVVFPPEIDDTPLKYHQKETDKFIIITYPDLPGVKHIYGKMQVNTKKETLKEKQEISKARQATPKTQNTYQEKNNQTKETDKQKTTNYFPPTYYI